jgi:formiminoglutamate deiminase
MNRPTEPVDYWCEYAWVGEPREASLQEGVVLTVEAGRIIAIKVDGQRGGLGRGASVGRSANVLAGITLPGMANSHSHAFHRLVRAVEPDSQQVSGGSFWTWRDTMYAAANELTPDSYGRLALDVFSEMLRAGYTAVGEFHYVHHEPDGRPYEYQHAMELALVEAAQSVGLRFTLLDTCYLRSGFGATNVLEEQRRFSDGTSSNWEARVESLARTFRGRSTVRLGAAIHSVRAVAPDDAAVVARWAIGRSLPLHAHVSEQPQENADCLRATGLTPTELLHRAGANHRDLTFCAVHATHLDPGDIDALGSLNQFVSCCPTTERVLADGISPTGALAEAGARLCVGSDSQSVIDPFEEMRAVEMHQRLSTMRRGTHSLAQLVQAASAHGYQALGWEDGVKGWCTG